MSLPRTPARPAARHPDRFTARVLDVVRRIPPGRLATYGDVADFAGRPRAARAVGRIMAGCHDPRVPCHRVVGANGALGGYGRSPGTKALLLRAEGIVVAGARIRGFDRCRWSPGRRTAR